LMDVNRNQPPPSFVIRTLTIQIDKALMQRAAMMRA
jgi:hypothetical protein